MTTVLSSQLRRRLTDIARNMVAGQMDLLDGVRRLDALATELGVALDEPYIIFKGIASQADEFPDEKTRAYFEPEALRRLDESKRDFVDAFRDRILEACQLVLMSAEPYDGESPKVD